MGLRVSLPFLSSEACAAHFHRNCQKQRRDSKQGRRRRPGTLAGNQCRRRAIWPSPLKRGRSWTLPTAAQRFDMIRLGRMRDALEEYGLIEEQEVHPLWRVLKAGPGWEPTLKHSVDARPREFSKCKRKKLTGKHGCGRSHQSYFSRSKIRVCASLYTEMLTYQSPSGTTDSVSMK